MKYPQKSPYLIYKGMSEGRHKIEDFLYDEIWLLDPILKSGIWFEMHNAISVMASETRCHLHMNNGASVLLMRN